MAKLERKHIKVFAENAQTADIGQFGSGVAGTKVQTGDIEQIQALDAWQNGWADGVVSNNRYPALQERNGIDKVFSYSLAYLMQAGIPEYNANTTYYIGSYVRQPNTSNIFVSLIDDNIGNLLTNETAWRLLRSLPSQTGNAGKFLTTDGTNASWSDIISITANTDLSNLSDIGKVAVSNYGMPDYSSGVAVTSPYTATYDCIFVPLIVGLGSAMSIFVDGIEVGREGTVGVSAIDQGHQYLIPEGSVLTFTATGSLSTYTVYRTKGYAVVHGSEGDAN